MRWLSVLFVVLFISGCSTIDMRMYRDNEPQLDLFTYFQGKTKGWGIVQDRKGELLRQFVVDIDGKLSDDGSLVLEEHFTWNDGERSTRTWTLDRVDSHRFTGTAEDVAGQAEGVVSGNVLLWQYQLNLKVEETTWLITFEDWMFKVSDKLLLNRATMTKFGFTVGEITIVFQKA